MRCHYAGRTMTNDKQVKIELLSQWKLEAEFRNKHLKTFEDTTLNPLGK